MRTTRRTTLLSLLALALLAGWSEIAIAQEDRDAVNEEVLGALAREDDPDEPLRGFYDTADLSLVITGGNSAATTLGLRNLAEYYWETSSLRFDFGGLSSESRSRDDRVAVETGDGGFKVVEADRQKTAENYFANLRYDYALSDRWYTFAIGGWDRNRFAGFDDRWQGALGVGWIAVDKDRTELDLDIGGTYTSESPILGGTNEFGGVRLAYAYEQHLTENTSFLSTLVLDQNLNNTEDLRADFFNAIEVSITELIFLRASFRVLWRNDPLFETLPLFDESGNPVLDGSGNQINVPSQLDPVDTYFLTSLVLKI
jgi:putative salt-induced outer membrane protein YdiY